MPTKDLTTTHFALLSLLTAAPMSAYDLVQQMGRSVAVLWPRAQSNLYAGLKRLDTEGLAIGRGHAVGRGSRTVYRITDPGRQALRRWLEQPGGEPRFECEALLKVAFANQAGPDAAMRQIDMLHEWASERKAFGRVLAVEHLEGRAPFPERLHVNVLLWRFLWEQHDAMQRWAAWARSEVEQWSDSPGNEEQYAAALETMRRLIDADPERGRGW